MPETLPLVLAAAAGSALGTLFFGGLWWTVQAGLSSRRPWLWFLGSMLLRTAVTIAGIYLVAGGQWPRLLACLFGFVLARAAVSRWTAPSAESPSSSLPVASPEAGHAP